MFIEYLIALEAVHTYANLIYESLWNEIRGDSYQKGR